MNIEFVFNSRSFALIRGQLLFSVPSQNNHGHHQRNRDDGIPGDESDDPRPLAVGANVQIFGHQVHFRLEFGDCSAQQ